ncbi:MAG: hypothetical protein AMXMBFR59_07080 [Rhodanobacteraceae bacterium]
MSAWATLPLTVTTTWASAAAGIQRPNAKAAIQPLADARADDFTSRLLCVLLPPAPADSTGNLPAPRRIE